MTRLLSVLFSCVVPIVGVFACIFFFGQSAYSASGSSFRMEVTPVPQCTDGLDNDADGKTDYPDDPDCESANDTDESTIEVGTGPSGGRGGGTVVNPPTAVSFFGYAYPGSTISLLKDAQRITTTIAGTDGAFRIYLSDLSDGSYLFSLNAFSTAGRRSNARTFSVYLAQGSLTSISNIVIAPTITEDRTEVLKGDVMTIFGESAPSADIVISVSSNGGEVIRRTKANSEGVYVDYLETRLLEVGRYSIQSKSTLSSELTSEYGERVSFTVGDENIMTESKPVCDKADLNCDGRVNLVDFSIAAFWFDQDLTGDVVNRERERLNEDGNIDLVDFSIMAYYWTG
jgi:hypothetical protein